MIHRFFWHQISCLKPLNDVTRWDKKNKKFVTVSCPDIFRQYNHSMGGTDLYMFMSLYKIDHKSRKWYRRIFFGVLSSCVVQGWILYKRYCEHLMIPKKDWHDLLSFATSVSNVLVTCDSEEVGESVQTKKRIGRPSLGDSVELSDEEPPQSAVHKKNIPEETRYDKLTQNLCTKISTFA